MSWESLGEVLGGKDLEANDNILAFFELARGIIRRHTKVEVESLTYKHEVLGVTVSNSIEATEVRLRHLQIERELAKRSKREVKRLTIRVL